MRVMEAILEIAQATKASMFFKPADSVWPFQKRCRSHLGCAQLFDHPGGASTLTAN